MFFLKGFLHDWAELNKLTIDLFAFAKAILRLNAEETPEEKTHEKSYTN